jgi:hypothetical protein
MRRASLLAVVGAVLVVAFAGVALAAVITCPSTGGDCVGTNADDQITGSLQPDQIDALDGAADTLVNGGAGNDTCRIDQGLDRPKYCETIVIQ